ncbi:MAG: glycosyltransferase family 9 protein, partial [Ignavibacteriales bacterium]|nr:glycosyltransferase family 9 protein [Ignavibacteriales bacterium]
MVIRFSSIGDIVLSTPLLRALRSRFPKSQIDFLVRKDYADLIRNNPNINLTYEFDTTAGFAGLRQMKRTLRSEGYDLIVDLHNSIRSRYIRSIRGVREIVVVDKRIPERTLLVKFKKNTYKEIVPVAERYIETLKGYGVAPDGKGVELHLPDEVLFGVASRVAKLRLNRFERVLGLCPFARHATKEWPAERFAGIGRRFLEEMAGAVMIFGGRVDVARSTTLSAAIRSHAGDDRVIDWTGELSLAESAAALQYC